MSTARLATLTSLACCSPGWLVLLLPVIAAVGGGVCLGESVTLRLILASAAILGGIALAILEKQNANDARRVAMGEAPAPNDRT